MSGTPSHQWQRANVSSIDVEHGTITCSMLTGPVVTIPYIGLCPSVGDNVWLVEVVPGAFMCMGAPGRPINPTVSVTQSLAQTVTSNVLTVITFDTFEYDTDTTHSWGLTAGGSLFLEGTAAAALAMPGLYFIVAQIQYAVNGVGAREIRIEENQGGGVFVVKGMQTNQAPAATLGAVVNCSVMAQFSTISNTVTIRSRQISGGNLDTTPGAGHTFLQVTRLGALVQPTS